MANRDGRIPLNVLRLKELRKKLGLSQERLAEECFQQGFVVSIASIKRAESGANVLYRTASNLAEYFSVPVEDLLIYFGPQNHYLQMYLHHHHIFLFLQSKQSVI